ncbi:hypothetical protein V5P93_003795 [Actinokineospora auranticolor]|uniref:Uncharacterized protein n=1 Tax=Actinokineospora auranticolor TaxID=155976 RepID=A0A2S6GLQ9_9PSEU|nr:hypothetical protein [Actinokineospora auranticolor]PPK66081.1 hypothetical protein CLV40_11145 [Actinokineospora auranticolor]
MRDAIADVPDVAAVVGELVALAGRARNAGQPLFSWVCLYPICGQRVVDGEHSTYLVST